MSERVHLSSVPMYSDREYTRLEVEVSAQAPWMIGPHATNVRPSFVRPVFNPGGARPAKHLMTVFVDDTTGVLTVDVAKYEQSLREASS